MAFDMNQDDYDNNPYAYTDHETDIDTYSPIGEIQVDGFHLKLTPEVYFTTKSLLLPVICLIPLSMFASIGVVLFFFSLIAYSVEFLTGKNQFEEEWMRYLILISLPAIPMIYYAPWIFLSNFWAWRLVSRFHNEPLGQNEYICQFATNPRRYHNVIHAQRAALEDADDIGVLSLLDDRVVFQGDHTFFSLAYKDIRLVERKIASFVRSSGVGGYCIRIYSDLLDEHEYKYIVLAERNAKTIPEIYRSSRKIYEEILARTTGLNEA